MNIAATLDALRPRLSSAALRRHGAAPFAVQVDEGPHLEWRFIEALDALAIAVALGRLRRTQTPEAGLRLLLSNLFLAEAGRPHFAFEPQADLVCLCHTVRLAPASDAAPLRALHDLLTAWAPARVALHELQVIT